MNSRLALEDNISGVNPASPDLGTEGCTGFRQAFEWIGLPVIADDGWPQEYRGVVDAAPGLFFCGLSFQYAFASMVFPGIGRDAAYVADRIDARARAETAPVHAA